MPAPGTQAYQFTLDTASADVSSANYKELPWFGGEGPAGSHQLGTQAIGFRFLSSATGAVATVHCVLVRTDGTGVGAGVQELWIGTVTVTARRQGYTNAAGGYVCDTVWAKTGTNYVDMAGLSGEGTTTPGDKLRVLIGMTAAGGLGTLRGEAWSTRNA